jgi:hypothetical protein
VAVDVAVDDCDPLLDAAAGTGHAPGPVGVARAGNLPDAAAGSFRSRGGLAVHYLERRGGASFLALAALDRGEADRAARLIKEATGGCDCLVAPGLAKLSEPATASEALDDMDALRAPGAPAPSCRRLPAYGTWRAPPARLPSTGGQTPFSRIRPPGRSRRTSS